MVLIWPDRARTQKGRKWTGLEGARVQHERGVWTANMDTELDAVAPAPARRDKTHSARAAPFMRANRASQGWVGTGEWGTGREVAEPYAARKRERERERDRENSS